MAEKTVRKGYVNKPKPQVDRDRQLKDVERNRIKSKKTIKKD